MEYKGKRIRIWFARHYIDCLTVMYDDVFYGLSKDGVSFNQFVGDSGNGTEPGNHLGRELNFIPNAVELGLTSRGY